MADDPSFEKKTEQLLVFLQNQVLELQRENLQDKATLTALEHYVLRLLHSGSGEPKEKLMKDLVQMVRQIHHGFLETLETKNPTLAAYLDAREIEDLPDTLA